MNTTKRLAAVLLAGSLAVGILPTLPTSAQALSPNPGGNITKIASTDPMLKVSREYREVNATGDYIYVRSSVSKPGVLEKKTSNGWVTVKRIDEGGWNGYVNIDAGKPGSKVILRVRVGKTVSDTITITRKTVPTCNDPMKITAKPGAKIRFKVTTNVRSEVSILNKTYTVRPGTTNLWVYAPLKKGFYTGNAFSIPTKTVSDTYQPVLFLTVR